MACDCSGAHFLPGASSGNAVITSGEAVPISVDWCAQVGTGSITTSTWSATPSGLTITPQATAGTVVTALVSSATPGTLYAVINTVSITPTSGSMQTYKFSANVYVEGALSLTAPY